MPNGKDARILEDRKVKEWLELVRPLCPDFPVKLDYTVRLSTGVVRLEAFKDTLVSAVIWTTVIGLTEFEIVLQAAYCQFRDWLGMPCPELEAWLRSNILPLDPRLSKSLERIPKPQTILNEKVVQDWFGKAIDLDPPYCDELRDFIIRQSLGIFVGPFIPKWMGVSPPSPSPVLRSGETAF